VGELVVGLRSIKGSWEEWIGDIAKLKEEVMQLASDAG
jgi:hypothetical protein